MGSRGRKSSEALAVPSQVQQIVVPDAPYDLTDEQTEVWASLALSLMQEYGKVPAFIHPNLAEQCRHVIKSRHVHQLIHQLERGDRPGTHEEKTKELDIQKYDRLLKMAERESRGIATHSVKIRAMMGENKKPTTTVKKPWEN